MTGTRVVAVSLIVLWSAACGDNELRLIGDHHHYVVSELRIPTNNVSARADALDLNDDHVVDNQLGMVFGTLSQYGLGVDTTAQEALLRGGLTMLADLQTTSFEDTRLAGFTAYLGATTSPAPCLDPTRLDTCGQHLLGDGQFTIDDGSTSEQALGPITEGVFLHTVGQLPVEIAIDATTPIRIDLHGARVRLAEISEDHVSAIIGGGIAQADIEGVVLTQAAAQMNRIVGDECGQPAGGTCGCVPDNRAELLQRYFDPNDDCEIEVAELTGNTLVQALLSPDVRIDGKMMLSFGVGVELARATFAVPDEL